MVAFRPRTELATHEVINQPPPLIGFNAYTGDRALREAVTREGAAERDAELAALGAEVGDEHVIELGFKANKYPPEFRPFDRYGQRIDEVEFHPAYHELMEISTRHGIHSIAWEQDDRPGGHVAHAAMLAMMTQAEPGVMCPISMTYACIPSLRHQDDVSAEWMPKILTREYDGRCVPKSEKTGLTLGMAMTEKQGGSDVRANSTRAELTGTPGEYLLTGHKWFCSAPMSDAFLTLAYTENGLTCFFVPRWKPDGTRNVFLIQRLKDKLGNKANASSEIEYDRTWARMIGEEGRGVRTIIEMVHGTRLDTCAGPVGLMRQAVTQAIHHASHRIAFQRRLSQQPLMQNVLADLALESEAATSLMLRIAGAYDRSSANRVEAAFARIAVAIAKYWINKRTPPLIYEALECHGGAGYIEESVMARIYREAPLNSIWEGSGNVICLDVLRAMQRDPDSVAALRGELTGMRGLDPRLDTHLQKVEDGLTDTAAMELRARRMVEMLALALQAGLLARHAPAPVAEAFMASRLDGDWGLTFGSLPADTDFTAIMERAAVQ